MILGKPLLRKFENGGYTAPSMFGTLTGFEDDDAMADYLGNTFGLINPGAYTEYFMDYDPTKENYLKTTYNTALGQADTTARNTAGTTYEEARKMASKGDGFGSVGRNLTTALGRTFNERDQSRTRAQQSLYSGIYDTQQGYVDDWMQMVSSLNNMGGEFCTAGQHWDSGSGVCVNDSGGLNG